MAAASARVGRQGKGGCGTEGRELECVSFRVGVCAECFNARTAQHYMGEMPRPAWGAAGKLRQAQVSCCANHALHIHPEPLCA